MKSDTEHLVIAALNASMKARSWFPLALCGLPLSYARDATATPYFFCSDISSKQHAQCTIEGVIGIIHQEFEAFWMKNEERQPRQPGFAVVLNILNLPDVRERRYIATDIRLETDVEGFCDTVASILGRMPHDEPELILAFEREELCGFPLSAFSGYAYRSKFRAFNEFMSKHAKTS